MRGLKEFIFGKKEDGYESHEIIYKSKKPNDETINQILNDSFSGVIAYQWVNWAAEYIGLEPTIYAGHPYTVKSFWIMYEGCKKYKEDNQ